MSVRFQESVRVMRPPSPEPASASAMVTRGETSKADAPTEGPSPFVRVLRGLGREIDQGERVTANVVRAAGAGRDPSASELLLLQSQIYRYTEVVDLASKLVDRSANGLRTVVQAQ